MKTLQKDLASSLNDILQFLIDSKACFAKHAEKVDNPSLKILFEKIVHSRQKMIKDIESFLAEMGEFPAEKGTVMGKAHMVFENIKSYLTEGDPLVITKEVRRGEGILIEYYKNALSLPVPDEMRKTLLNHLNHIQDDIKESDMISVKNPTK